MSFASKTHPHTLTLSYLVAVNVLYHSTKSKHPQSVIIWTQIERHALLASNEGRNEGRRKRHQGRTECEIQTQTCAEIQLNKTPEQTEHFIPSPHSDFMNSKINPLTFTFVCIIYCKICASFHAHEFKRKS